MINASPSTVKQHVALDGYLLLTLSLTIFVIAPLFYPGYFQTHTGFLPLWSISRLKANLADLSWLPVLVPFQPWRSGGLLPYYLAALLPASPLIALKLVSMLSLWLGSSGLYLWLRSWLGAQGATVAAVLYSYAPFTVATLYVRGAWSEGFFWGLLPWALLAATYLVSPAKNGSGSPTPDDARRIGLRWRPSRFKVALAVVASGFWAALGLSQLGLSLVAFVLLAVMLLIFHRPQALWPLVAAAAGLMLALGLTFPRLIHEISPAPLNFGEHLVYPAQLLSPFWGYGVSRAGWEDGLSLSLGLGALGLAILSIVIWRGGPDRRPWFFAGLALVVALLVMPSGGWFWRIPGLTLLLDNPWQLLGFAGLGLAVLAGVGFWLDERLRQFPLFGAALLFAILPMVANLEPQFVQAADIPSAPEAIYGENEIVLLAHEFLIKNPTESTPLNPVEPYLPLPSPKFLQSGDTFYLRVRWQAVKPLTKDYKIFAHLVDADGQLLTQVDTWPQDGERLTRTWLPGEQIDDRYTFTLPAGRHDLGHVWLGFYDEASLTRLPALGDDEGRAFLEVR